MSVEIKTENYYMAHWYISVPPEAESGHGYIENEQGVKEWYSGVDVMGIAWREPTMAEDEWTMRYRFRYYTDGITNADSKDIKNWYEMRGRGPEDKVFAEISETFALLADRMGGELSVLEVRGDGDKMGEMFLNNPPHYVHVGDPIPLEPQAEQADGAA